MQLQHREKGRFSRTIQLLVRSLSPSFNSSIRELYRELRNDGDPVLIKDNIILLNLPILNSPTNGPGGPDPTVQTVLSTAGYFDGVQTHSEFQLPGDMLYPTQVWERASGTNNPFVKMTQVQESLPAVQQGPTLCYWEWRNNNINFIGATQNRDIRLRYYCSLPQFFSQTLNFDATFVPVLDCTDAVAYKTAVKYARMLGSPGLADLKEEAMQQMFQLKNANTRRMQFVDYQRIPYGHSDGDMNNNWFTFYME